MYSYSQEEFQQLLIASIIFVLVELSILLPLMTGSDFTADPVGIIGILLISALLILPLFVIHELAHKYTAIKYGFPAKFYLDQNMAIFSLLTILFPIKLIAPGAVVWYGNPSDRIRANVSMMGPLVNIFIGGILLLISSIFSPPWTILILFISKSSFDIALFNLIPYSILDGAKVYKWSKEVFYTIFGFTAVVWLFHPLGILGGILQ